MAGPAGGEKATLRRPTYTAADPGYGPLHPDAMFSPRVAPQMIGMGLLEAIPTQDILAWADPEDADGDGISGRPQVVWSDVHDQPMLGRFGHKAGNPTVLEQASSAFAGDMGISNPIQSALIATSRRDGLSSSAMVLSRAGPLERNRFTTWCSVWPVSTISSTTSTSRPAISPRRSLRIRTSRELSIALP